MTWVFCESADSFLHKRRTELAANASLNTRVLAAILDPNRREKREQDHRFLTYDSGPVSSAHAFLTHSRRRLVLGAMSGEQAEALLAFFLRQPVAFDTVEGPRQTVQAFAMAWDRGEDATHQVQLRQGVYEVTRVTHPDTAGGQLVRATAEHVEPLQAFVAGFHRDCFPHQPFSQKSLTARVQRFLREKRAYLWRSATGEMVSLAAIVRETPSTASISFVYTPSEKRGRGHAGRIVAALSQEQLDAGKKACNLYTDLSNPTSNGVYLRVGYQMIGEAARIRLSRGAQDGVDSGGATD